MHFYIVKTNFGNVIYKLIDFECFRYYEWMCNSGEQCIPKSFHCDRQVDCQDQSDEIGCSKCLFTSTAMATRADILLLHI